MNETLKIISQKENPLFKRKEVEAELTAEISPSREDLMSALARKLSSSADAVRIKKVKSKFGSKKFSISANVYQDKETKKSVEIKKQKEEALDNKPAPAEAKTGEAK
ncbi:hypothetical protein HYT23_00870 [Candidatus Pacearchaeota archaeon]|nr:hypothetical protein [Candidatus Pacearchaeota archaeon]